MKSKILLIISVLSVLLFFPYVIIYIGRIYNFSEGEYAASGGSFILFLIAIIALMIEKLSKP